MTVIVLSTSVGRLVDGVFVRSVALLFILSVGRFFMSDPFLFYGRGADADATDCRGHLVAAKKGRDHSRPFGL